MADVVQFPVRTENERPLPPKSAILEMETGITVDVYQGDVTILNLPEEEGLGDYSLELLIDALVEARQIARGEMTSW